MTYIAGADLAFSCVAAVAVCVGSYPGRDGLPGVPLAVTRRASITRPAFATGVGVVVELHIETLDKGRRKCFHRRIV